MALEDFGRGERRTIGRHLESAPLPQEHGPGPLPRGDRPALPIAARLWTSVGAGVATIGFEHRQGELALLEEEHPVARRGALARSAIDHVTVAGIGATICSELVGLGHVAQIHLGPITTASGDACEDRHGEDGTHGQNHGGEAERVHRAA